MDQAQQYPAGLKTANAEAGLQLALTLARKAVGGIQTDVEVRKALRPQYASDTAQLIASAQVVAQFFDTVAAANNWWR